MVLYGKYSSNICSIQKKSIEKHKCLRFLCSKDLSLLFFMFNLFWYISIVGHIQHLVSELGYQNKCLAPHINSSEEI